MARFVFYCVNLDTGEVDGTNEVEALESLVDSDSYIIIHKDSGTYFYGSRQELDILPLTEELEEEEDGDLDD